MLHDSFQSTQIRLVKLIFLALMGGVFAFAATAFVMRAVGGNAPAPAAQGFDVMVIAVLCLWGATTVSILLLPGAIENATRREWEGHAEGTAADAILLTRWRTLMILRGALLEGAALFGVVVYFLNGSPIALGVAGANLVLMAMGFPSQSGFESFLERVRRQR
jgi:hypothetical protein